MTAALNDTLPETALHRRQTSSATEPSTSRPRVILRDSREDDLPLLSELRRDLPLQALLLTVPEGTSDALMRSWIERRRTEPGGTFRIIEDANAGVAVGYAQVAQVHRRNRTGYGGLVLSPKARGRGMGRATLQRLIEVGRSDLGLIKLLAEMRTDNPASLGLHLALGYRLVGSLERHFTDGALRTHDVLLLERVLI